ncbi:L,D-transpeptidase family protein [Futiania mangrovi]|uniref:L,D-transpeptidase family protein n=1 Tax=Futiania mangrovi TaxID=2959716 RepID=A0A9J6PDY1_9PROT|nr:L,D-transpeptidase family protein [Futiania mangrovii]MCP1335947.1 L,D-transpeptidase family protein [Futiania mangrovii]
MSASDVMGQERSPRVAAGESIAWRFVRSALLVLVALAPLLIAGYAAAAETPPSTSGEAQAGESDPVAARLAGELTRAGAGAERAVLSDLRAFYAARQFRPAWTTPYGLSPAGLAIARTLAAADRQGLAPSAYALPEDIASDSGMGADRQMLAELVVARALMAYARDVRTGVVPEHRNDEDAQIAPKTIDLPALMARVADAPARGLADLPPQTPAYRNLVHALALVRALPQQEPPAVPEGPSLHPGDVDARIPAIRERLIWLGDHAADMPLAGPRLQVAYAEQAAPAADAPQPDAAMREREAAALLSYDPALEESVRRFQSRHGLGVDGVVGPRTVAALNVGRDARIAQVVANLERERWQPEDQHPRQILVNVPAYHLAAFENGAAVLEMDVIVGREERATPLFHDRIRYLEFHPTWTVPTSIAVKDIAPAMVRDPLYIAKKGITVYDGWAPDAPVVDPQAIDWSRVRLGNFRYRLEQAPGPANSLGSVKFMFPNRFAVYLHDTPTKNLFWKPKRTFSSGCVRVAKPRELAYWLLGDRLAPEEIDTLFAEDMTRTVGLTRAVPVSLVYRTAWVAGDGQLAFREDIYSRDARLIDALARRFD